MEKYGVEQVGEYAKCAECGAVRLASGDAGACHGCRARRPASDNPRERGDRAEHSDLVDGCANEYTNHDTVEP